MRKIVITGAAGLVGQNLITRLSSQSQTSIVAIDKHPSNTAVLRRNHPEVRVIEEDLASDQGPMQWRQELQGCDALVIAHAQIGGTEPEEFHRNNVLATQRLLEAASQCRIPYLVNISSSVVNSMAVDNYTETKKQQEALVAASGIKQVILRPTLMFGWYDRKHLGWLARFMKKSPLFPIPGSGRYLRQPLYVGDFCSIIMAAIASETTGAYNITGLERIDYIDLIRALRTATGARVRIQRIPYWLFALLLRVNAIFDSNPAFTADQLRALVTPDVFEVIDWPAIFAVRPTPLKEALHETCRHPVYSAIELSF
ncbi:MAG: NAD(P)-dependent oxidoreductase [Acidobacteriaceae bacterium]